MDRVETLQATALTIAAGILSTATKEGTPWDARQKARMIGHLAKLMLEHLQPGSKNPPGVE